jgi:hypothetical protein
LASAAFFSMRLYAGPKRAIAPSRQAAHKGWCLHARAA